MIPFEVISSETYLKWKFDTAGKNLWIFILQ